MLMTKRALNRGCGIVLCNLRGMLLKGGVSLFQLNVYNNCSKKDNRVVNDVEQF